MPGVRGSLVNVSELLADDGSLDLLDAGTVQAATWGSLHPYVGRYVRGRVERREIAPITADRIRISLDAFDRSFGNRPVKNMGRADIERWIAARSKNSVATRRAEFSAIRGFTRWLQLERIIKGDPMVSVRTPKPARRVPRALTHAEVERLRAVLPDARARAIVALMLGCGLRRIEVIRLQVGDWDRHARTLQVCGKSGHERHVPVTDDVAEALSEYLGGARLGPMIRSNVNGVTGVSTSLMQRLLTGWLTEAGVKHAAHDGKAGHALRHTIASEVADVEPDLRVVQELLGHASLSSTQIYLRHAGLGRIRAAMETAHPPDDVNVLALDTVLRAVREAYSVAEGAGRPELAQSLLRAVTVATERVAS